MRKAWLPVRRRAAFLGSVALAAGILVTVPGEAAQAALPSGGMSPSAVASMLNSYADTSGQWSGGDGTISVPLPHGRDSWIFNDSFIGTVTNNNAIGEHADGAQRHIATQTSER